MSDSAGRAAAAAWNGALGRLAGRYQPYVVASAVGAGAHLHDAARQHGLAPMVRLDPFRRDTAPFLSQLRGLVGLVHEAAGTRLPRWALYDCGEVPGAILGLGRPADQVPSTIAEGLGVEPGYTGLVPLSMAVAIPMVAPGTWHVYGLGSINQAAPPADAGPLRLLTLTAALIAIGPAILYGVSRWTSDELDLAARFAPLEVLTAWTPAHGEPASLTYRFDVTDERVRAALGGEPATAAATREVDGADETALRRLQGELEAGRRYEVPSAPRVEGRRVLVPLREAAA